MERRQCTWLRDGSACASLTSIEEAWSKRLLARLGVGRLARHGVGPHVGGHRGLPIVIYSTQRKSHKLSHLSPCILPTSPLGSPCDINTMALGEGARCMWLISCSPFAGRSVCSEDVDSDLLIEVLVPGVTPAVQCTPRQEMQNCESAVFHSLL